MLQKRRLLNELKNNYGNSGTICVFIYLENKEK